MKIYHTFINMKSGGFLLIFGLLLAACQKDYLVDSGKTNPLYEGTIWKYLNDKPELFDSLTQVINLANMQDVFEYDTITFFAPANATIYRSFKALNNYLYLTGKDTVKQLSQIKPSLWKELLSLYIIKGKYVLKDIPQLDTTQLDAFGGQGYISYAGVPMNIGVIYNDEGNVKYAGYRQLFYSYIDNFSDDPGSMINVPVASSDIQPYNGVVHVLRYQDHAFGFKTSDFILKAISLGIGPEGEEE